MSIRRRFILFCCLLVSNYTRCSRMTVINDAWEIEKEIMEKFLNNSDMIQFNVAGEMMYTSRATLLHVPNSKLTRILLNRTNETSVLDKDGFVFFDLNPKLFRHLLEQLRLSDDDENVTFSPPSTSPLIVSSFNSILEELDLKSTCLSDDDILTFNVGDEIVSTRRKTLQNVPKLFSMNKRIDLDSNGRPFLDYDPKLFRHLLSQLQSRQTNGFQAPSHETKAAYNAMLFDLSLIPE